DSWARVTGSSERTVTHHAAWTRIDEVKHGRPSTTYIGADNVSVYVTRASSGAYASLAIRREAPPQIPSWFRGSSKSGERQVFLGEGCDDWVIRRWDPRDVPPRGFSCVTDDGIELWRKGGYTVTGLQRRPVQAGEVLPPDDVLDLRSWIGSLDKADAAA